MFLLSANARRAAWLVPLLCAPAALAAPGDHIRTGDTTITPAVDVGFEYRNNVYRAAEDPLAGGNLRVAPQLSLGVDSTQNAFEIDGEWELRKFLFVSEEDPDLRALRIAGADRFNDFNVGAALSVLRNEAVGLELSDRVTLRNNQTDRGVLGSPFFTQVRNELQGGLRLSPGEALDIIPGGQWSYDDYRIADESAFRTRFNSRHVYGPRLDVSWDFFPRTSMVLEAEGQWNRWGDNSVPVVDSFSGDPGEVTVPDSVHVRVLAGLQGRFTERIFVDLIGGYGTALYDSVGGVAAENEDLTGVDGLIGSAGVRYRLVRDGSQSLEAGLGFTRDFSDAFFTNYALYNQVHAQLGADIAGLLPKAKYSIRFEEYQGAVVRNDVLNRFDGELGYPFKAWGKLTAGVAWQQRAVEQAVFEGAEYDEVIFSLLGTFQY